MTKQEIFDLIIIEIYKQGGPSVGFYETVTCPLIAKGFYRHPNNGRKCPAGMLIPDSVYKVKYEEYSVLNIEFFDENYSDQLTLIFVLQKMHDNAAISDPFKPEIRSDEEFFKIWKKEMIELGDAYKLSADKFLGKD